MQNYLISLFISRVLRQCYKNATKYMPVKGKFLSSITVLTCI